MKKTITARIAALSMLFAAIVFGPLAAHANTDTCAGGQNAGNSKAAASDLSDSLQHQRTTTCVGETAGADVWYKWTFNAPAQLLVHFVKATNTPIVFAPGSSVGTPATNASGPEWSLHAKPGTWYLEIPGASSFGGDPYEFNFFYEEQQDCHPNTSAAGQDGANTAAAALSDTAVQVSNQGECGGEVWGNLGDTQSKVDPEDWFKVSLFNANPWRAELVVKQDPTFGCASPCTGTGVTFELRSTNALAGYPVIAGQTYAINDAQRAEISYTAPAEGADLLLHIKSDGDYLYSLTTVSLPVDPGNVGNIPNGVVATAQATASAVQSTVAGIQQSALGAPLDAVQLGDCSTTQGTDAPGTPNQNYPLPTQGAAAGGFSSACTGSIGHNNDQADNYFFSGTAGQRVEIVVASAGPQVSVALLNSSFAPKITLSTTQTDGLMPGVATGQLDSTGPWYLQVKRSSGAGNYLILMDVGHVSVDTSAVSSAAAGVQSMVNNITNVGNVLGDCRTGPDAPNSRPLSGSAPDIGANTACVGTLGIPSSDGADWYSFHGVSGQDVLAVAEGENTLDFDLDLYNPAGTRVWPPNHFEAPIPEYFRYTLPSTGQWSIALTRKSGAGHYGLFLSNPEQPAPGVTPPGVSVPPTTVPSLSVPPTTVPSVTPPSVLSPDCNTGHDAGNASPGTQISTPTACTGNLGPSDTEDYYNFSTAQDGQRIEIGEMTDGSVGATILLYYYSGGTSTLIATGTGIGAQAIEAYGADRGTYVLRVHRTSGSGQYGISVNVSN